MKTIRWIALFAFLILIPVTFAATSGPSPIPPAPNFQISTQQLTVCRGVTNNIPIAITNLGNGYYPAMVDVQISLQNKEVYEVGNEILINKIGVNNTTVVDVPVFVNLNASSSLMEMEVPINYNYLTLYSDSEIRNITFEVETCPALSVLSINVSPSVLISGQINNLTFSFTNLGNTTLNDISARASIQSSQSGVEFIGHQPIEVNSIAPKSTINITEGIYENSSQIFPLNVSVTLLNGTNLEQISDSFAMLSSGTVNMVPSSVTVTPSNLTPGSIFSISFIITDTGTAGVSDAMATAILPKGFRPYGSSGSSFIGSIQTDSQTPISLTLIGNESLKSGSYIIPIKISYLNGLRENLSTTVNVPIVVGGAITGSGFGRNGTFTRNGTFGSNTITSESYRRRGGYFEYIEIGLFAAIIASVVLAVLFIRERKRVKKLSPKVK